MAARRISTVMLGAVGGVILYGTLTSALAPLLTDVDVYWHAAERLRVGAPLYAGSDPTVAYRYAPWFAVAWVPLTLLPRAIVGVVWAAILLVAGWYSGRTLRGPLALLLWPTLFYAAWAGNVHTLMLAGLIYGLPRRSGPLFIALAASLKAFPLLFVLWYVGRREWRMAFETLILTGALVLPMLAFDLSHFGIEAGATSSLFAVAVPIWGLMALLSIAVALRLTSSRYGLLAVATTVIVSLPRLLPYDFGYLLVGLADDLRPRSGTAARRGNDNSDLYHEL